MVGRKTLKRKKGSKSSGSSGGAKIGEGAFGCVYKPSIRCNGNTSPPREDIVSKIIDGKSVQEELNLKDELFAIDREQQYFIYPLSTCKPSHLNFGDIVNCPKDDVALINYAYGGSSLEDILIKLYEKPFSIEHVRFFEGFLNLLHGIKILHDNGIAHLDIKSVNVVGLVKGDGSYWFRFIDFGLSKKLKFFTDRDTTRDEYLDPGLLYWNDYFCYPFDLRFLRNEFIGGHNTDCSQEFSNYHAFINSRVKMGDLMHPYWLTHDTSASPSAMVANDLLHFLQRSRKGPLWGVGLIVKIVKKTDIYSMGLMISDCFTLLTGLQRTDTDTLSVIMPGKVAKSDKFNSEVAWPMFRLIDSMTRFDFRERAPIEEIIEDFSTVLEGMRTAGSVLTKNVGVSNRKSMQTMKAVKTMKSVTAAAVTVRNGL